jgi:hypothetical protein
MSAWSDRLMQGSRARIVDHGNGVVVHGSGEPVLSVLDVLGAELEDIFVIGINDRCGSLVVPTQEKAERLGVLMNPAYKVKIKAPERGTNWKVDYDQRNLDGTVDSNFIINVTLKDGRVVMKDGKWIEKEN